VTRISIQTALNRNNFFLPFPLLIKTQLSTIVRVNDRQAFDHAIRNYAETEKEGEAHVAKAKAESRLLDKG
jgi:hypothetical protein